MVGPSFGGEDEETMTGADLRVEVRDQDIIVTMPETSFRVVYRKPNHRGAQLVARLDYAGTVSRSGLEARERQGARIGVDCLGLCCKAANDPTYRTDQRIDGGTKRKGDGYRRDQPGGESGEPVEVGRDQRFAV